MDKRTGPSTSTVLFITPIVQPNENVQLYIVEYPNLSMDFSWATTVDEQCIHPSLVDNFQSNRYKSKPDRSADNEYQLNRLTMQCCSRRIRWYGHRRHARDSPCVYRLYLARCELHSSYHRRR